MSAVSRRLIAALRALFEWSASPDPAWRPSGYRYTATGFEPALRERSAERRAQEDRLRRAAARIASTPRAERRSLRVVGHGSEEAR